MSFEIIEHDIGGYGYLKAFLLMGNVDIMFLEFYKEIYPEISHFENNEIPLLETIGNLFFESEQDSLLFIDRIEINPEYGGMGLGREAVTDLIENSGSEFIMLIASPIGETEQGLDSIVDFYSGFGLVKNLELKNGYGYLMSNIHI